MKNILTSLLLTFGFFLLCIGIVHADVTQFSFATDPQSIPTGTLSGVMTIQSQDGSGTKENIASTMYITVTSSSPTGQFFSNTSGSALSNPVTMAKNSANKNFYYQDSVSGTYSIQVSVAAEKGGPTLYSTSQPVYVGVALPGGGSSATSTATTTPDAASDTSDDSSGSTGSSARSAYSSPVPLSTSAVQPELEVSAGRDRLAAVGSVLTFQAAAAKIKNLSELNTTYQWSFGDGTSVQGRSATHAYAFPGDYEVVLNASNSDRQAVDRISVKVISPILSLSRLEGGVEVWNKSADEINLEGWNLSSSNRSFVIPKDTLIGANKKVVFADQTIGFSGSAYQISNPAGKIFAMTAPLPAADATGIPSVPAADAARIADSISTLKQQLAAVAPSVQVPLSPKTLKQTLSAKPPRPPVAAKPGATSTQTAAAIQAPAHSGFVSTLFAWPIKGFGFFKHLFVEE
jgi:hypothetical protein